MLNRIEQSLHFFEILFCTLLHQREHVDSANRLVLVAKKYDHVVFASNLHIVNRDCSFATLRHFYRLFSLIGSVSVMLSTLHHYTYM